MIKFPYLHDLGNGIVLKAVGGLLLDLPLNWLHMGMGTRPTR